MSEEKALALRLADELERQFPLGTAQHYLDGEAAAELRRLHAAHDWQYTMAGDRLRRIEKLEAVNAELLKALKLALSSHGVLLLSDPPQEAWKTYGVEQKALAAIKKAEEV